MRWRRRRRRPPVDQVAANVTFWLLRGQTVELRSRAVAWPIIPWPEDHAVSRERELALTLGARVLEAMRDEPWYPAMPTPTGARQRVMGSASRPDGGPGGSPSAVPASSTGDPDHWLNGKDLY